MGEGRGLPTFSLAGAALMMALFRIPRSAFGGADVRAPDGGGGPPGGGPDGRGASGVGGGGRPAGGRDRPGPAAPEDHGVPGPPAAAARAGAAGGGAPADL